MAFTGMIHPIKGSKDREVEFLFGTITVGSSGAVASQDCNGFSVAKESADGTYTVTLDSAVSRFLYADAALEIATPADSQINRNLGTTTTTATQFEIVTSGSLANVVSGDKVHFMLVVSRSSLPRKGLGS